jgi:hypothetical protein
MRKTLVLAALIVSSVLLLQTAAWAPNLYLAQRTTPKLAKGAYSATVAATSDCNGKPVKITFKWGKTVQRTSSTGDFTFTLTGIPKRYAKVIDNNDIRSATCGTAKLPFTGAATAPLLAFGVSLLVAGALLLLVSRRPVR